MMDTVTESSNNNKSKPYPIVAIGASAGGMEAVTELLQHLPAKTGMAYVYIQHLDRDYKSNLTAILERVTKLKVQMAENLMKIEPDCLFVIPPNKEMSIVDGVIKVAPRPSNAFIHMPIDRFFSSLAEKQKDGSIGIVLSGAASDGTVGLKAIKTAGGFTFAQDESARFQSMPKSAIAEGVVDLVLSPKEIAEELERLSKQADIFNFAQTEDEELQQQDEELKNVLQLIQKSTGVDFTHYKVNTIRRRIMRRMLLYKLPNLSEYVKYIKQHANEVNILYSDLLINVTTFFRDPEALDLLKNNTLPKILESKTPSDPFRIWVPACSTGEEAYSLAMIILEVLGDKTPNIPVQIFATDLSELAISKARHALYTASDVANVSEERLQRFFTKIDGSYRINKVIRDICVFAPHNIFKDPPFSRIDLISCCNLLIYLDNLLQKKVIGTFRYGLNDNGYLLLGKSETVGASINLFHQADKKVKLYTKRKDALGRAVFDVNVKMVEPARKEIERTYKVLERETGNSQNLEKIIDNIFLTQYVPPTVIINHQMEIIQFRGQVSLFIEPAPGRASLNILKMVRTGLAIELRGAILSCIKTNQPVKKSGLEVKQKDGTRYASIEVSPLEVAMHEPLLLIVFEEIKKPEVIESATNTKDRRVKQLENEIIAVREEMRALLQEQEAANEELQSANEEIVSSNEELQSINEELETSKEEMESTNEELMTINNELMVRNDQLAESQEYTEAVIFTIREAVLILDKDLRVKTANKAFYRTFQLREDVVEGRLIYELGNRQWDIPRLRELLEEQMNEKSSLHGVEIAQVFPEVGEKVLVMNARKVIQKVHRRQFILLAIEDITDHRKNQRLIAEREAWLRTMFDNVPAMIWVANTDRQYTYLNNTWHAYSGRTLQEEKNNGWLEGIHKDDVGHYLDVYNDSFKKREPFRVEYRMRRHDGEYRWVLCSAAPTHTADGEFSGFTGSCIEVHNEKMMNEELEKRVAERTRELQDANMHLKQSNKELEQFAYVASHDLQEPLRKILTFSDRLVEYCMDDLSERGRMYVEKINNSSHRMTQLIDDLLNFSRIAQPTKEFVQLNMKEMLEDILDDFELMIKDKEAEVKFGQLPVLEANPLQMKQLFHNLLSNAIKFTAEDRKPVIEIKSRPVSAEELEQHPRLDKNRKYCEIIFEDNGIGFSPEFAEQVFVIFQRLHERSKYAGTGIGLALCRKIIDNHSGVIYAESEENKGAAFHIILPEKQG